jgi:MFS family permease
MWSEISSNPVMITLLLIAVLGLGELISIWTKARIPMLLAALLLYISLLWTGIIPNGLMSASVVTAFGSLIVAPFIVHLGTLVPFLLIKGQLRPILIALTGSLTAVLLVLAVVPLFFDYQTAVAGAGPVVGGIVAYLVTSEKLTELGLSSLVIIPALVLSIHKLFGIPLASFFLKRHALIVKQQVQSRLHSGAALEKETAAAARPPNTLTKAQNERKSLLPKKYQTSLILILQLYLGSGIAVVLDALTGVNYTIFCLIIGVIGAYIGFYPPKTMEKANATGFAMIAVIFIVISSMDDVTPASLVSYIPEILLICALGTTGVTLGGLLASKFLGVGKYLGMPVALTALFGFPADYILCEEISREVGETEEEREAIMDEIVTPMLMGGFTTVTTCSILIATVLIGTLN